MSLAYISRYGFGFVFLLNILVLYLSPQYSWAGSADNSQGSPTPTAGASSLTPQGNIDVIQNFNSGANSLNSSSCSGVCAFGSVKLNQNNGTSNHEAVVGVFVDFNSPQKRHAKAQENLIKAQTSRIDQEDHVSLLTKLADAVEECRDNHANLLALAAAKRLGMTHEEVLSHAYKEAQECESPLGH